MFVLIGKRISLVFEFPSDGASVRYFGVDATREFLISLNRKNQFWLVTDHPPIEERLKRVEEYGRKVGKSVIDFNDLEKKIPQIFVF